MTQSRASLVDIQSTPFYHCYLQVLRNTQLCGKNSTTGQDYTVRATAMLGHMQRLASIFAIDICAYAIMPQHYHVILHVNTEQAHSWTPEEVAKRWLRYFKSNPLIEHWLKAPAQLSNADKAIVADILAEWRQRLASISWFMRSLNEAVARSANKEDDLTGRFWQGRYKSQALLDSAALAAAMIFAELNPLFTDTPRKAYPGVTSKAQHLAPVLALPAARTKTSALTQAQNAVPLMAFASARKRAGQYMPLAAAAYAQLLQATETGPRKPFSPPVLAVLQQLQVAPEHWFAFVQAFNGRLGLRVSAELAYAAVLE